MVNLKDAFVGALVGQMAQEGAKGTVKIIKNGLQNSGTMQPVYAGYEVSATDPQQGKSIVPLIIGAVLLLILIKKRKQ